ncbi:MAG: rhodanese-like domain-containing protein [Campylobacteraceae bacterium]|nr:rhodanese-like domain-containing protein [Campylobacteraceae bacterium]
MNDESIDDGAEEKMTSLIKNVTQSAEISAQELRFLLDCREKNKVHFTLIDIREIIEYSTISIKGTDLLLPTSNIHTCMNQLQKLKENFLIFYCRSGNRTAQMLQILRRMGFTNIAHLSRGIIDFGGEKLKNAPLPKNMK